MAVRIFVVDMIGKSDDQEIILDANAESTLSLDLSPSATVGYALIHLDYFSALTESEF